MNKNCPFGRSYNNKHSTCRSCTISCKEKLSGKLEQHKSKYGNSKTVVDGICFDSKKEAARYQQLKMMEWAGLITDLKMQVKFELIPKNKKFRATHYVADFVYLDKKGNQVTEDVKGFRTAIYQLKKKLMYSVYGIELLET